MCVMFYNWGLDFKNLLQLVIVLNPWCLGGAEKLHFAMHMSVIQTVAVRYADFIV